MTIMQWVKETQKGFTIVELLIVVVVIAILAAITIVAYNGIQNRAYTSKVQSDLRNLENAIRAARNNTSQTMMQVTSSNYTAGGCRVASLPDGVDLSTLDASHTCWATYANTLDRISTASGINVRGLVDPWGWPYAIDENEGESGGCGRDSVYVFHRPLNTYATGPHDSLPTAHPGYPQLSVPRSGFTGCAAE